MESLLYQVRDLAHACDSKGIELLIDMLSFGVPKGVEVPDVSLKVVDVDGMWHGDEYICNIRDCNIEEAKWALQIFIQNYVEEDAQKALLNQIENYNW